jgi:hypothetical protein
MKDMMKLSLPPKLIHCTGKNERQDETQFTTKIDPLLRKNERQDETQFTTKIVSYRNLVR